jgi:hypothetical protein
VTYIAQERQDSRAGLFLFFVALLLVVIVSVAISYADIPNTEHAANSHVGEKWNVDTISSHFDAHKCTPKIYDCGGTKEIHTCELPEGGMIALIIGKISGKKVTGYKGTVEYWNEQIKPCNFTGYAH